jgi:hypothetical protein
MMTGSSTPFTGATETAAVDAFPGGGDAVPEALHPVKVKAPQAASAIERIRPKKVSSPLSVLCC